jgi:hypothetical protein
MTYFSTTGTVDFANQTTTFPANTVKLAVTVSNWPFHNIQNSLVSTSPFAPLSLSLSLLPRFSQVPLLSSLANTTKLVVTVSN